MPEVAVTAFGLAALAVLIGPLAARSGRPGRVALIALLLVVLAAALRDAVVPADALHLAEWAGLSRELALLLSWGAFAALLRAAGRPWLPEIVPPMAIALGAGALLGELGAAAVLGAAATSRAAAARLALAAVGGAMLGRVGDPALLVLGDRLGADVWMLAPLGLLCAMIAWPVRGDLTVTRPPTPPDRPDRLPPARKAVTAVALGVGLAAQVPDLALPALGLGAVALGVLGASRLKHADGAAFVHTAAVAAVALVLVAGGAPGVLAWLLEDVQNQAGGWLRPAIAAGSWLAAVGLDSAGAGMLVAATLDRAQSLQVEGAALAAAAGAASGGFLPLVLAGAVREGWRHALAQGLLVLLAVALVL